MPRQVDYYFSLTSPWAYIGHRLFMEVARRHDVTVRYRPVTLWEVFADSGGLPLAKRHILRQRYRMVELQRWRARRGLEFHLQPAFWPFDATLADGTVAALAERGADVEAFLPAAYAAVWEQQKNLADPAVVADLLQRGGIDPGQCWPKLRLMEQPRPSRRTSSGPSKPAFSARPAMCWTVRSSGARTESNCSMTH